MTGLSVALANLKPGTGKTTSAVWLTHVFARAGNSVLLVDADPSGSALEWSDLAAMDPRLAAPQAAFPFRIVALPSRELHRRLPDIARDDDVVIIDTPQIEDHAAIARSALRYADEIVIPCAPNPIEINRTTPVRDEINDLEAIRDRPARSAVLLNRCITRAHSVSDAREALQDLGYDVLATAVPRLEVYAQSFGMAIPDTGCDVWRQVVRDLIERCAPPCPVRPPRAILSGLRPGTGCACRLRNVSTGPLVRCCLPAGQENFLSALLCTTMWITCAKRPRACARIGEMLGIVLPGPRL
jgi:chromosome partitioning protein